MSTTNNKIEDKEFDVKAFNKVFEEQQAKLKEDSKKREEETLKKLNEAKKDVSLISLSIGEILINTKDAWFDILDDLLQYKFGWDILTKNNRLFYIGLTLAVMAIIFYLYEIFTDEEKTKEINVSKQIIEIHHIGNENNIDDDSETITKPNTTKYSGESTNQQNSKKD